MQMKMKKLSKKQIETASKVKKQMEAEKERQLSVYQQNQIGKLKNNYIQSLISARYFKARCNMIAEQLNSKDIFEHIDGYKKSEEFMRAEYAKEKARAIDLYRNVYFSKKELTETYKVPESEFQRIEEDYYNGKIMRDTYESEDDAKEAKFVKVDEETAKKEYREYVG